MPFPCLAIVASGRSQISQTQKTAQTAAKTARLLHGIYHLLLAHPCPASLPGRYRGCMRRLAMARAVGTVCTMAGGAAAKGDRKQGGGRKHNSSPTLGTLLARAPRREERRSEFAGQGQQSRLRGQERIGCLSSSSARRDNCSSTL